MDWHDYIGKVTCGDCLELMKDFPDKCVDAMITSPPYWGLRDYGVEGQLGLEPTFQLYLDHLMQVMAECKRVLKDTGTMWINIGDTYGGNTQAGNKVFGNPEFNKNRPSRELTKTPAKTGGVPKSLVGIPERFAIRMTDDLGMIRRNTIIWWKRNAMPSSVKDRFTVDFEPVYFFVKQGKYWFEQQTESALGYDGRKDIEYKGGAKDMAGGAHTRWHFKNLQDKGQPVHTMHLNRLNGEEYMSPIRNRRCVWDIPTKPFPGSHFAVFPEALVEPMILAGCHEGGVVLDPFMGSGTVGIVATNNRRNFIGIELNPEYAAMAINRISPYFAQVKIPFDEPAIEPEQLEIL